MERIYGIHNGGNDKVARTNNVQSGFTQEDLANQHGRAGKNISINGIKIERLKAEERQASTRFGGGAKICATEGKAVKLTIRKHLRRVSGGGNISTAEGKVRDIVAQKTGIGSGKQFDLD